ncbi:MAG: hypothetical protein K2Q15_10325 [Burkholderiales bacterium]|nr:hypothetical protein [Burkholderiales bacterium]
MALQKCRECAKEISTEVKICPYCGVSKPTVAVKVKKKTSPILLGTLGLLFFGMVMMGVANQSRKAEQEEAAKKEAVRVAALTPEQRAVEQKIKTDRQEAARVELEKQQAEAVKKEAISNAKFICGEFVKKSLHDPDSAQFEDFRHYGIDLQKGGVYLVQVDLRAKNGFGAMRRMMVNCRTKLENGNWVALSLKEVNA